MGRLAVVFNRLDRGSSSDKKEAVWGRHHGGECQPGTATAEKGGAQASREDDLSFLLSAFETLKVWWSGTLYNPMLAVGHSVARERSLLSPPQDSNSGVLLLSYFRTYPRTIVELADSVKPCGVTTLISVVPTLTGLKFAIA